MVSARKLLLKIRGDGNAFQANASRFGLDSSALQRILDVPAQAGNGFGALAMPASTWFSVGLGSGGHGWDEAHGMLDPRGPFSAAGGPVVLTAEPDFEQDWRWHQPDGGGMGIVSAAGAFDPQDASGTKAIVADRLAWNLDPDFSQFKAARSRVGTAQGKITVAHLDTGFDPRHSTVPSGLLASKQNNVMPGENANDAQDRAPASGWFTNRGHGAGTLSILAGNKVPTGAPGWTGFTDFVGAAPGINVIPVRIADGVARFTTSTMVAGFNYARAQGVQVLSMSMGGLSSAALVDAINLAYEAGVLMVTAGGNNFSGAPTPKSIVFPARYKRVIAACGVMGDGRAYSGLTRGTMQGNFGPPEKMATALGAFTPNVPWAEMDAANIIDMDGAGTSAATPQIAAAAALWLAHHWDAVKAYQPWARIEAARHALFISAAKTTAKMGLAETLTTIGNGIVLANAALDIAPRKQADLHKLPPAEASWSWVDLLFGGGVSAAPGQDERNRMLALELTQLAQRDRAVDEAMVNPEAAAASQSPAAINRYLEAALDSGKASRNLQAFLEQRLGRKVVAGAKTVVTGKAAPRIVRKAHAPPPPRRRLRIFALDPTLAKTSEASAVHQAILSVPWDDKPSTATELKPGPVGEYLEVIDVDPASRRVYDPVDLNDRALLAQDGYAPSEGNPQFHQQMVYAVAMTTIGHFERALGRRALWAPHYDPVSRKGFEVPRLRIYPHALRARNAYYSPDKVALLFGYFQANSNDASVTVPGSMVFSCLSSDIIAHEMSHALLDGLHRRFQEASNPDVPAFHEAFADIVAMFQHFTLRELVRFEIGRTRGDLRAANMLSGLAQQFGEGAGRAGPLRDYGRDKMNDLSYERTMEPHDRGSILVIAVYEAFLSAVTRRTVDLTSLATGGRGILPDGALHPGLVDGLTDVVVKTAQQFLTICIRALDYCPPVDITFGEYLRAIITSDVDACPEDPFGYRLAFMESFRAWKLIPRDMRTVSSETLIWDGPATELMDRAWVKHLIEGVDLGWSQKLGRSRIFELNEENRWNVFGRLKAALKRAPELCAEFGLLPNLPRFDEHGRIKSRPRQGKTTFDVFNVRPTRRVEPDGSFRTEIVLVIQQRVPLLTDGTVAPKGVEEGQNFSWFRGGATVIIDPSPDDEKIRFIVLKSTGSARRQADQMRTATMSAGSLRSLYFGSHNDEPFAMLHAHDHEDEDSIGGGHGKGR